MREARYMRLISWTLQSGSEHVLILATMEVAVLVQSLEIFAEMCELSQTSQSQK